MAVAVGVCRHSRRCGSAVTRSRLNGSTRAWRPAGGSSRASKPAAALEEQIRSHLAHRSAQREVKYRIHGNHVRVRFVEGGSRAAAEVIGFVHNPDSDPNGFLDRTQSLLERIHARGAKGAPLKPALDRWLVVADEDGQSHVGTYRYVLPQLSIATDFKKTLVVLAGGRIELLTC